MSKEVGEKRPPHPKPGLLQLGKTRMMRTKGNLQCQLRSVFLLNSLLHCGVHVNVVFAFRCPFTKKKKKRVRWYGKATASQVVT